MSTASYVSDVKSKISLRPSQRAVKRAALALALTLGIAAVADLGYDYLTTGRYLESTDDAYVKADSTIISPKVSGYIAQVLVGDNQPVKAGQLLARIDDRDFKAALDQAHADVAASEAAVRNWTISLAIRRDGNICFAGETAVGQIKRGFEELAGFLFRCQDRRLFRIETNCHDFVLLAQVKGHLPKRSQHPVQNLIAEHRTRVIDERNHDRLAFEKLSEPHLATLLVFEDGVERHLLIQFLIDANLLEGWR